MDQTLFSFDRAGRWLICGSGQRWVDAARRFAPDLMPEGVAVSVTQHDPSDLMTEVAKGDPTVVLWQISRPELAEVCTRVSEISMDSPRTLQLAAAPGLANWHLAALSELGCRAIVRHPEDLMGLATLIGVYFASLPKNLD